MNVSPALVLLLLLLCCAVLPPLLLPAQCSMPGARSSNAGIRVARIGLWGVLPECIGQRLHSLSGWIRRARRRWLFLGGEEKRLGEEAKAMDPSAKSYVFEWN